MILDFRFWIENDQLSRLQSKIPLLQLLPTQDCETDESPKNPKSKIQNPKLA